MLLYPQVIIDFILFGVFCCVFKPWNAFAYIAAATVSARIFSAAYNYLINYKLFAIGIMLSSAVPVTAGTRFLPMVPAVWIKILTDTVLFLISYKVQQLLIY